MRIEQPERNLRITLQPAPDCRRDRLPGLAAQPGLLVQFDDDAAHGPYLVVTGGDVHADAEVFVQALLQTSKVFQVPQVFQAFEQAFFFLPGQQEDALGGLRMVGQLLAAADAGARGARLA